MADKQSISLNNLFFYGVSFAEYDTVDISRDIITNIRMRFLVSGKSASNKLYRSAGNDNFVYYYNFTVGKPLQWKVVRNKHIIEEIEHLFSEKYCINFFNDKGQDFKKVFFDSKHRWFKTNYYNTVSNESLTCSLVPKEFDEGTSILKYMTGAVYPERLLACVTPSCDEVRRRVLARIRTPHVTALTNIGIVYFMPEDAKDFYEKVLYEEEERFALENAPEVYVSADEAKGGFNLDVDAFDMSKNLNRTFDISLAEEFFSEENEESKSAESSKPLETVSEPQPKTTAESEIITLEADDGSVDAAIAGVVNKINSFTSLDIKAEDIINIDISGLGKPDVAEDSKSASETVIIDGSDPAIDARLKHIDSVLDGTSLLNSDKKLIIGDSVVDEDYISSIIDGIIASAFNADDEVAGIAAEGVSDFTYEAEINTVNVETADESSTEIEVKITDVAVDDMEKSATEVASHSITGVSEKETHENFAEEQTELNAEETVEEDSADESHVDSADIPAEISAEFISAKAVELISKAVSDTVVDETSEKIPADIPEEDADVNNQTAEVFEGSENNSLSYSAPAEDYIKDNHADITIESRGEAYYYYGSVDENGKRSGRGRTLMSDGSIAYEGEYLDDKRKGQGSFYFKDGSLCYWGNWDNNVRSGFGVGVSSEDKAVHAGNWVDNKPSGFGIRFDSEGNLMFISSSCEDKKKGFTISDFSDTSFTVRAWSEKDEAFIQREIFIKDIIK